MRESGPPIFQQTGVKNAADISCTATQFRARARYCFAKKCIVKLGGADEKLVFCGDWKTWASMALIGASISYVGEPLNYCRFHDESVTTKSRRAGTGAAEVLQVVSWILEKVDADPAVRAKVCNDLSYLWIPAVMNRRFPVSLRRAILRHAATIDHDALRRLVRPTISALRLTLARRWRSIRGLSPMSNG